MASERVLVVDDHAMNLELVRALLEGEQYEVGVAQDANEALAAVARGFRPQLVLMDIQMPGMDGLELTRRLKADAGLDGVKVVALTAYAMRGDRERMLAAGCDGYIAKPIDTRAFPAQIRAALEGSPPMGDRP